MHFYVAEKLC